MAARALPWRTVLERGLVLPYGSDALYHLRRIRYSVVRFPESLDFDRYVHFPEGAAPIWTPVLDWTLALVLRPWIGPDDGLALERAAVWVPPLLGGATVVALYALARRSFGEGVAWLAAGTLVVLSAHFWYSQIGFVDHHAAVALVSTLLLGTGLAFVRAEPSAARAIALGVAMAAALLVWPGSLLHVALVQSGCLVYAIAATSPDGARARVAQLALAQATACLLVLPLAATTTWPQWGRFSPVVLGGFQPGWLATSALLGAGCARLWRSASVGASPGRRALGAAVLGIGLLAAGALLVPGLAEGAGDAWRWLARREAFQVQVAESRPLLWSEGRLTLDVAVRRLSLFFVFLPLALAYAWRAARRPSNAPLRLLLWWSVGLLAATLAQRRFFNSFAVALALLLGWTCVAAWRALPPRRRGAPMRALFAAAWVGLLAPSLWTWAPYLRNEWRAARGEPLEVSARRLEGRVLLETARWMRHHTPATAGWLDAARVPEYGVLGPWEVGHAIQYEARRPAVVDNFGDDVGPEGLERAARYFRSAEPEAVDVARKVGARYAVVGTRFGFGTPAPGPGSCFRSLRLRDGAAGPREPAFSRHRIVYESRPVEGGGPGHPSQYKVFEIVPGAVVRGRAAPGSQIELELPLRTNRGRKLVYRATTDADAAGRYALRVPYANRGGPDAVRVAPRYRLRCGADVGAVRVDESSVQSGAEVAGPDLCPPP